MLLHRKNESRDASSRSLMRYACPAAHRRRLALGADQELRAREQQPQRELDAVVEACRRLRPSSKNDISVAMSCAVGGRRYARRASVVRICSRARRSSLTASRDGSAREDLAAARGVGRTLGVERALDAHEADRRVVLHLRDRVVLERLAIVLPDHVEARAIVRREERRADEREPALTGHRHVERAVAFRRHARRQARRRGTARRARARRR